MELVWGEGWLCGSEAGRAVDVNRGDEDAEEQVPVAAGIRRACVGRCGGGASRLGAALVGPSGVISREREEREESGGEQVKSGNVRGARIESQ